MNNRWISLFLLSCLFTPYANAAQNAVDLEVINGEGGLYILYDDGFIQTGGQAVNLGYPRNAEAVDLTLTPSRKGYYVVEEDGTVHSFGDAVVFGQSVNSRETVVDMELFGDDGFYFLRDDGTVITVGSAVLYGEMKKDGAVEIKRTHDGKGYYVLYEDGTLAFFGSAVNYGFEILPRRTLAVDFELVANGYYILTNNGTVLNFGDAVPLPSSASPKNDLVAMQLTGRGYRTLDETGETQIFYRLENTGSTGWFAQVNPVNSSPNQVATPTQTPTLTPTRTPTATSTPRPTSTPRANTPYLDLKNNGFTERVVGVFPQGVSIPNNIHTGQLTLPSGDTFMVAQSENEPVPRSIVHFSHNTFDDRDNAATVFAQLLPERGAASIRGLSFSRFGLHVSIADESRTLMLVIEGNFDVSAVDGFMRH